MGLIKWPLDCEPRSSMGLIAHPGPVKGLVLSYDGRKLITLGEGARVLAAVVPVWVGFGGGLNDSEVPCAVGEHAMACGPVKVASNF